MKILIDAGHGDNTPGKRSPDGTLREYKYCREIAHEIVARLLALGYDAEELVTETYDVTLAERCRRVNTHCAKLGASNVVMVSVHCNAAGSGGWKNATGWEVYTTRRQNNSDKLATLLYNAALVNCPGKKMRTDFSDGDPDKEANFYIINGSNCPCCLTENFFQDSKEDVAYLLSDEGRNAIISLHVDALREWVWQHEKFGGNDNRYPHE